MDREERRAQGIKRVPVERIVEICGRDTSVPAFEAESVELSGRGMHVKTPYLPELGAPLVCRLEERGREIVVEGVVAWRSPTDEGGEFGVKFTALDSGSVETLKELCGLVSKSSPSAAPAPVEPDAAPPEAKPAPAGAPVKLHIEGLAAPMKARVRRGSGKRLHVGSNLEFLKVGRTLEIEDLELRERKGARIDSVSVAIDPETQVPQLVVALRYEGVQEGDITPEPSTIGEGDDEAAPPIAHGRPVMAAAPTMASRAVPAVDESDDAADRDDEDDDDEAADFRDRVEGFSTGASKAARAFGGVMTRLGEGAAVQMGSLFQKTTAAVGEYRARQASQKKRVTSKAPPAPASTMNRRLRPQGAPRDYEEAEGGISPKKKKIIAAGAIASLLVAGIASAFAFTGSDDPAKVAQNTPAEPAPPAAAAPPPAPAPATAAKPAAKTNGIVADVPLFGPTPMATMEPAPLDLPPEDGEQQGEMEAAEEEAAAEAPDERFEEPAAAKVVPVDEAPPKPVEPWVVGKMHMPVIHRIKLDAAGIALEGAKKSSGFTVFLPKRKLLESGKSIARRDDRIVEVRTSNEPGGARVTFVFQGKVPAYKVRLKKDYVEFFISSPDKS